MDDRINELKKNEKKIFVKIIILMVLIFVFTFFGLPLCVNNIGNYLLGLFNLDILVTCSFGFLMWGLIEIVLYKLLKKLCEELEFNYKECLEINRKIEHDKAIENIKKRFDSLSVDKKAELLNFIRDDNEIRKIFLDVNEYDLEDRENLGEYFLNSYLMNTDDCIIKSQRPAEVENLGNALYARKRCLRTERKRLNMVNYSDSGQLHY